MYEIIDRLYLADQKSIKNKELLQDYKIQAVLNCAKEIPCYFEEELEYFHIPVLDSDDMEENNKFFKYLEYATQFIKHYLDEDVNVVVHCKQAIQRSPAVIAAYLMKYFKLSMKEAMEFIKTKRPEAFFYQSNFETALTSWEMLYSYKK